jgi:hypothetical protein
LTPQYVVLQLKPIHNLPFRLIRSEKAIPYLLLKKQYLIFKELPGQFFG